MGGLFNGAGILMILFVGFISIWITVAIIRYAINSSDATQKLDDLLEEVSSLRSELKQMKQGKPVDERL